MVKFDADKLGDRLDKINREQFDKIDTMFQEVLGELRKSKATPKRAEKHHHLANRLTGYNAR